MGKTPGSALDPGMGQGRNALYLAAHGWRVTGVDLSDTAIGWPKRKLRGEASSSTP